MKAMQLAPIKWALCSTFALSSIAAPWANAQEDQAVQLDVLRRQIEEQTRQIAALKQSMATQEARYRDVQRALGLQYPAQPSGAAVAGTTTAAAPVAEQPEAPRSVRVGAAPQRETQPLAVAPLFEQPGILTPKGTSVVEPSIQYAYSSNNRVALVGYTVIPALLIGLIDVREVKRNTVTAALTGRFGITNHFEVEAKVPYVYRSDATVSREIFTGTANENAFNTSGKALGDVELTGRYQFNDGDANKPYMIGTLRFKSRTGKDPFDVVTDCITRCVGNTSGTGLPTELPTGSGFLSLQPGLTWLFASDPAVFFGSFSYTYNFKRNNVYRRVLNGESEFLGSVEPGDILGMNFGMGLALNDRASFSAGFDLNSIGRTKQNGVTVPASVRTQLATLLLGYSHRLTEKTTLNVSVGAGLTRDTPDLTLNVRLPMSF
ncbi:hypothetical protein RCH09_003345 [Actimicrobium sp. GrIS 1.19]|nr:hypothetical protein [Actimicrobium sp. GrIS 1.19]